MKKKIKFAAALGAGILLLATGGSRLTLSYLTSQGEIENTFTVGDLDIGLHETDWNPEEGDGKNVYPGYSVYKNPTLKNITTDKNGPEPCYARMRILLQDSQGQMITDDARLDLVRAMIRYDSTYTGTYDQKGTGTLIEQGRIPGYSSQEMDALPMINPLFQVDEARSKKNEIVCNYMARDKSGILQIGEEVTLFTTLAVPTNWKNAQIRLLGDFRIVVKAEAIQVAGFASQTTAFEALDTEIAEAAGMGA